MSDPTLSYIDLGEIIREDEQGDTIVVATLNQAEVDDTLGTKMAAAPQMFVALQDAADCLLANFGQVADPNSRAGWSDDDAYETYMKAQEVLRTATF